MTDPARQILPPNWKMQFTNKDGTLTNPGMNLLQQIWGQIVNTNQMTPCTVESSSNLYALTTFSAPVAANVLKYSDYAIFSFVADATSTGDVTVAIMVPAADGTYISLGTKNVYKDGGASVASTGDVVEDSLYMLIYNSALDSGNGGFVLK